MNSADKRNLVWRHNSFFGSAMFAQKAMNAIIKSSTTTRETKKLAEDIQAKCVALRAALKTRIDTDELR